MSTYRYSHLRRFLPVAGVACGALICSSALAGAPLLEVVVYSDLENSPPGFPSLFWNLSGGFSNPVIDNAGNIAFTATIFGDGIIATNNRALWYGGASGWSIVARSGNPALSLGRLTFAGLTSNSPALSPTGMLSVSGTLAGTGVTTANDTAFWYGPIGAPGAAVARESTTVAPGPEGATLSSPFGAMGLGNSFRANNAGQVFFSSNLTGGTPAVTAANNFGTYIGSSSGITEVARKGNPIPGAPALPATDGPFMTPDSFGFAMNGAGEAAHTGTLVAGTAGGVTTANDKVLYTTVGGPLRIVAREDSPVPGLTDVKYKSTGSFSLATMGITNAGKVVFNATLDNIAPGTSVSTANDTAWLVDDHATVTMAVREGDAIDGETFSFAQSSGGMFLNNNNNMAIAGNSTAATNAGRLWYGPLGGPYTAIVKQGVTEVPGSPGVILNFSAGSSSIAFNNADQIVFSSSLTGVGVTSGVNDTAIFGWNPAEGLVMLARMGVTDVPELLDISNISLIGATGITGENGSAILTDNGWLTFRLQDVKGFQAIARMQLTVDPACVSDMAPAGGDNTVDVNDLLEIINHWGACPLPCPGTPCPGDIAPAGGDCQIDVNDLLSVINHWGACP